MKPCSRKKFLHLSYQILFFFFNRRHKLNPKKKNFHKKGLTLERGFKTEDEFSVARGKFRVRTVAL